MNKSKFITTTLPYANGDIKCVGHIGHAFEFIIGDALSRYFRHSGYDVFFNIGLDEHGLKIQQKAESRGITPQQHVDEIYLGWIAFIEKLDVNSWDNFYRTSDNAHKLKVQKFWIEAMDRGDIYKKKYTGNYCVGCESFKIERDLYDNKCPEHPTIKLVEVNEENYFFKISKYQSQLIDWANKSNDFIEPSSKRAEFLNIIENIQDISVSRLKSSVSWGVPVPGDEEQIIYIWWDALTNYLFASGLYENESKFEKYWNNSEVIQICGPDNLKFQSAIFQGLLQSAGIKKTDKLLVHGTILDSDGRKMSKTVGNVVDPIEQVGKYGVDAVRYYALAGLRTYGNSSWDEKLLVELHNSHLADDFGNLISRVSHLAGKFLKDYVEDPNVILDYSLVEEDKFCSLFNLQIEEVVRPLWDNYKISEALDETNKLVKSLNKKFGEEEPWKKGAEGWVTILEVHYAVRNICELYKPVLPGKISEVLDSLDRCEKSVLFPKIELK